ncbi:unnamed protein product, partial [Hapterophycus canaliculatus]
EGEEDDQEAEESASKVLRRLSSPIFGAGGGFNSDSDDEGDGGDGDRTAATNNDGDDHGVGDGDEVEDERKEGAAGVIQRWWRERRRASKRARAVVAARPAFVRIQQLLDKLNAGKMSFERTGLALQNQDIQRAVTKALASVPRDETLIAMPRASRQEGSVLSSLMIVYHPDEVLTAEGEESGGVDAPQTNETRDGKTMDPVATALTNASALLLASITAVNSSLGSVAAGETGARK